MPKTLPERIFFTIVMAAIMVYGMIVYNVALNTNGVTNATFVMALHEMPIMVPVAFVSAGGLPQTRLPPASPYPCRKEEKQMNKLTQALMEELTVEYVKVGSLQIPESVVISWVIMLLLVVGSILLTRNLKVDHISKRQAALEALYSLGKNFFEGLLGKEGSRYVPYLMTVALYIACSNVIGVFGVKPPTKDLDVTAALALMSIVLIEYAGVRARGGAGFLKSLAAPTPIMTPMNILEIAIRPTSLCMRLFGNVLGAFVIMELLKLVVPVFVPAVFSLYFDLFDGLIQTYVFVFLTALFMKESIGGEE